MAHELARPLEADHPDLVVSDMKKSLRAGQGAGGLEPEQRREDHHRPLLAARPAASDGGGAPHLGGAGGPGPAPSWTTGEVLERVKRTGDPLAGLAGGSADGERWPRTPAADRLSDYRSMRDPARTPEPVPRPSLGGTAGRHAS